MTDHIILGKVNLNPLLEVKSQLDNALANILAKNYNHFNSKGRRSSSINFIKLSLQSL